MEKDKSFLGTKPVGKLLLQLALPTVAAQLINMLYNIVDRIYIGHIPSDGSLALTGVGVCMPIIMIVTAFAALGSSGGAPRASIYMGKQDNESAENILGNCFLLQIVISLILTAIFDFWGFAAGVILYISSMICNKKISGYPYLYPVIPFSWKALSRRFFRSRLTDVESK